MPMEASGRASATPSGSFGMAANAVCRLSSVQVIICDQPQIPRPAHIIDEGATGRRAGFNMRRPPRQRFQPRTLAVRPCVVACRSCSLLPSDRAMYQLDPLEPLQPQREPFLRRWEGRYCSPSVCPLAANRNSKNPDVLSEIGVFNDLLSQETLVAGAGFEPAAFRL